MELLILDILFLVSMCCLQKKKEKKRRGVDSKRSLIPKHGLGVSSSHGGFNILFPKMRSQGRLAVNCQILLMLLLVNKFHN